MGSLLYSIGFRPLFYGTLWLSLTAIFSLLFFESSPRRRAVVIIKSLLL